MFTKLHIQNYALLDNLDFFPSKGFNAITGETGAGKSIILGALSLLLGKRSDAKSVGDATKKCVVEATFSLGMEHQQQLCVGLDVDLENELILRREILVGGRNRTFINDTPVKLAILAQLSSQLFDIHSQHNTLTLVKPTYQLDVLDHFCSHIEDVNIYKSKFNQWKAESLLLQKMRVEEVEFLKESDYKQFLLAELEQAHFVSGEQLVLEEEQALLLHADEITQSIGELLFRLDESDESFFNRLLLDIRTLERLSAFSPRIAAVVETFNGALSELNDASHQLRDIAEEAEFNPARSEEISARLDLLYNLQSKHRVNSIDELVEVQNTLRADLLTAEDHSSEINRLELKISTLKKKLDQLAQNLSDKRQKEAKNFSKLLEKSLLPLGMKSPVIALLFHRNTTLSSSGSESLSILFSANSGSEPKPLSQTASGGELSRVMLAIKAILSDGSGQPTLIFDEIDTGVSGSIAYHMGAMMRKMSERRQLLAISHLPQIAALAEDHFLVFKKQTQEKTVSSIVKLSYKERISEIAAMLSADKTSDSAIRAAEDLLNS